MNRFLTAAFLAAPLAWGAAYTSTTACAPSCNLSARASWSPDPGDANYPGKAAANKDTITVSAGHRVVADASATLGSSDSSVGHAFTVQGVNAASYGTLEIASGATLTLRGNDQTDNTMGLVQQYAYFKPLPGATLLLDPASDRQSIVLNRGHFIADGTGGAAHNIYIGLTPTCYDWATPVTGETYTYYGFRMDPNRVTFLLAHPWISNAAGTGPGSVGDSSLVFVSLTPGSGSIAAPSIEVATLGEVDGAGKFYVNYDVGTVAIWGPAAAGSLTPVTNYKYLKVSKGAGIWSVQDTDYSSFISRNASWQYLGNYTSNTSFWALDIQNKASAGKNANRVFEFTNNKVRNTSQFLRVNAVQGTADSPVRIEGNDIGAAYSASDFLNRGYFLEIYQFDGNLNYLSFSNNTLNWRNYGINHDSCCTLTHSFSGWTIRNNTGWAAGVFSDSGRHTAWPDLLIEGNDLISGAQSVGANPGTQRIIQGTAGTSGHPAVIQNNRFRYAGRGIGYLGYTTVQDNTFQYVTHHGLMAGSDLVAAVSYVPGVIIRRNLFIGEGVDFDTAGINSGYNHNYWIDGMEVSHNTAAIPSGLFTFGDGDWGPYSTAVTGTTVRDNLVLGANYGQTVYRDGGRNRMQAYATTQDDNNWYYGPATTYYTDGTGTAYHRGGTFRQGAAPYNTSASRNVTGVSLWNPSYDSYPSNGHTLTYTHNSATDRTLKWDSGTAAQIVWPSAGTSYTVASACSEGVYAPPCQAEYPAGRIGRVTVSGTPGWSDVMGDPANATAKFLVVTSGAAAGEVHYIGAYGGTGQLVVAPDWGTLPSAGDTFVILNVELVLDDGAGKTVNAGVDPRYLAAGTRSDSAIDITYTDAVAIDPQLLDPGRTGTSPRGYTPLSTAAYGSASDGGTVGAVPYPFWSRIVAGWMNQ